MDIHCFKVLTHLISSFQKVWERMPTGITRKALPAGRKENDQIGSLERITAQISGEEFSRMSEEAHTLMKTAAALLRYSGAI